MRTGLAKMQVFMLWGALIAGMFNCFSAGVALAVAPRLTLEIPIGLSTPLAAPLPEKPLKAEEIYPVFNQQDIALRMEALRRAGLYLSNDEKNRLWVYLNKRRDKNTDDANLYFDVGYADITLRLNKTGLFFLRKASERLRNPFANMAYAMAQADVDLLLEGGKPDTPSYRKLDVVYKLSDAIALDAKKHYVGLWPTFVRIQQGLAQYPAYTDFSQRDYSDTFIPFGERPKLYGAVTRVNCTLPEPDAKKPESNKPATKPKVKKTRGSKLFSGQTKLNPMAPLVNPSTVNAMDQANDAVSASSVTSPSTSSAENTTGITALPFNRPLYSQAVSLGASGDQCLDFFQKSGQHYEIRVRDGERLLGSIESYVGVGIIEDIDADGHYELVIRQYRIDPFHPVLIYRLSAGQAIQRDEILHKKWFE
jgi:hypothetical protein